MTQTIDVTVNGDARALAVGDTLRDLVAEITGKTLADDGSPADGSKLGIAAAVDGAVVRRGGWNTHTLESGQTIDIVTAVQGG
ncbi:sulfur carrier protein ThiS [Paramicrobacterium fandaimingii]|uniref:sulfur carrier protein ThiS n=1 Tax=Paramicrobacterium fandaimingii TaxID=2708079 RepID=UPI0014220230|nr:sulfur carrier protein ThiS [Microbacterium fandaimingii]